MYQALAIQIKDFTNGTNPYDVLAKCTSCERSQVTDYRFHNFGDHELPYNCICEKQIRHENPFKWTNENGETFYFFLGSKCIETLHKLNEIDPLLKLSEGITNAIYEKCRGCEILIPKKERMNECANYWCKKCRDGLSKFRCRRCNGSTPFKNKHRTKCDGCYKYEFNARKLKPGETPCPKCGRKHAKPEYPRCWKCHIGQ